MRRSAFLVLAFALAACTHRDEPARSSFTPVDGTGFHYEAVATAVYPEHSKSAEATRMHTLEQYLLQNKLCPKGYTITDRTTSKINQNLTLIVYDGVCK